MKRRHLAREIQAALRDTPVVLLLGPRQCGKSTLVQSPAILRKGRYLTLDDPVVLAAAKGDPSGFVAGLGEGLTVLDEVQRAPELFLALKVAVDRDRRPGRFLLTGSANVLLLPRVADSLAGRMQVVELGPFSHGEIVGRREGFLDVLFGATFPNRLRGEKMDREELVSMICLGGFPEVQGRKASTRRRAWFDSYLATVLQRDVRELANIQDVTAVPRLLSLLAARVGALVNHSLVSQAAGIPQSTLKRYQVLLERLFLVRLLPAWSGNLGKRLIQAPKLYLNDTGLLAHLQQATPEWLREDPVHLGPMLENFVVMELQKQLGWSTVCPGMFHWRTAGGQEVDVVLEDGRGRLVGIEIKATMSPGGKHFSGLRALKAAAGRRFQRGVVLYTGSEVVPFATDLYAVPLSALWRW